MAAIDDTLRANDYYALTFSYKYMPRLPARKLVILTCMDARINPEQILGVRIGDAHVLRNAGGIVTEDVLRSLLISCREMGTQEMMIIQHTHCGLLDFDAEGFRARLRQETGQTVAIPGEFDSYSDLETNIREQVWKVRSHPWIPDTLSVRGFIYDVDTGRLKEITPSRPYDLPKVPEEVQA